MYITCSSTHVKTANMAEWCLMSASDAAGLIRANTLHQRPDSRKILQKIWSDHKTTFQVKSLDQAIRQLGGFLGNFPSDAPSILRDVELCLKELQIMKKKEAISRELANGSRSTTSVHSVWLPPQFSASSWLPTGWAWCPPPSAPGSVMSACVQTGAMNVEECVDDTDMLEIGTFCGDGDDMLDVVEMRDNEWCGMEVAEVIFGEKTDEQLEEEAELRFQMCEAQLHELLREGELPLLERVSVRRRCEFI